MTHDPLCPCNNADERGCFLISAETDRCVSCICPALRACEQRVERRIDFMLAKAHDYGERTGHAAGVQAARDAVAAYADERLVVTKHPNMSEDITAALRVAVARIDALRGES